MNTFPHPGTSPSSHPGDASVLQRALAAGHTRLPRTASGQLSPSDGVEGYGATDGSGGRRRARRTTSSSSIGGRLSPTQEQDAEDEEQRDFFSSSPGAMPISVGGSSNQIYPAQVDSRKKGKKSLGIGAPVPAAGSPLLLPPKSGRSHSLTRPMPVPPAGQGGHKRTTSSASATGNGGVPEEESESEEESSDEELEVLQNTGRVGPVARRETKMLLRYTIPIVGTHMLEYSLSVATIVSLGHLGTIELAAASIASMTVNVVALSVIQGFASALDTLCPQAFTSRPKDTSLYALRTMVILVVMMGPQAIVFWLAEPLLIALRQDPRVAHLATVYLRIMILGLPGYAGFECVRRWLQAQGIMMASTYVLMFVAPVNAGLQWLLVHGPESMALGYVGAPIASAASCNLMFILTLLYAYLFVSRDAYGGVSWAIFRELGQNVRLGLAGSAMIAGEWWGWELVSLASSFISPEALGAQSILVTSSSFFYQIPYSLSVAASVRIGNLLGAQRPATARASSRVALALAVLIAFTNSLVLILARKKWGKLFSSDDSIIELVAGILPLVALFQLADGVSGATGGILRGAGRAPLGAIINLGAYYVVGIPAGFMLAFLGPKLGLYGLWLGLTIALATTGSGTAAVVWWMNWEKESEKARIRMGAPLKPGRTLSFGAVGGEEDPNAAERRPLLVGDANGRKSESRERS